MKLIYTPIDIPCKLPDEQKILDWFHNHCLNSDDYWEYTSGRHKWAMISTSQEPSDWRKYDDNMWKNRRTEEGNPGFFLHPTFQETFPEISNCLRQLPFKQLTVSGMLYQIGDIPLHNDTHDPRQPTEPRRYTIYLTDPDYCTFYFDVNGERVIPKINKDYCCFAFNNSDLQHGAFKMDREKIILTCAGILDNEKHEELLNRSIAKFKDELIYI